LFYAVGKDVTAFASMASGLAGAPGISAELNPDALARAISDVPTAEDSSYFRVIRKVRPGHMVRVTGSRVQIRDYWQPAHTRADWVERPDLLEEYGSVLDEVVGARLRRSGGAVSAQLSS